MIKNLKLQKFLKIADIKILKNIPLWATVEWGGNSAVGGGGWRQK